MKAFRAFPHHGNVVFNFNNPAVEGLSAFADGYHVAGKLLVLRLSGAVGYADYEGYPIFYLYRHALELYIKAIVYKGAKYAGLVSEDTIQCDRIFSRHRLSLFLPALQGIWKQMEWEWDFGFDGMRTYDDFVNLIREIEEVDPESFAFRYPTKTNMSPALPHHFVVNVIAFGHAMDPVLDCLSGAVTGIDERWDSAAEIIFEAEQAIRDCL